MKKRILALTLSVVMSSMLFDMPVVAMQADNVVMSESDAVYAQEDNSAIVADSDTTAADGLTEVTSDMVAGAVEADIDMTAVSDNEVEESVSDNEVESVSENTPEAPQEVSVNAAPQVVSEAPPTLSGADAGTPKAAKNLKVSILNGKIHVTATVKKKVKSKDNKYYLVMVDPDSEKVTKAVANVTKSKKVKLDADIKGANGLNRIHGKFAIGVKVGRNKYKPISSAIYISNPQDAAEYTAAFPVCKSKKGMQGLGKTELGGEQYFMNVIINESIASSQALGGTKYVYNGKTYWFKDTISQAIKAANKQGMVTTAQFMMTWPGTGKYKHLILGSKSHSSPTPYYAINASNKKSRALLEAYFCFLAERMSSEDCHLDNWVLGNEVNIYPTWFYAKDVDHDKFMENYANLFRIVYYSVKSNNKNARVYICTDHTWTDRCGDWGAKGFMASFNKAIKKQNKKIKWNLAYHAYPAILTSAATWKDKYTTSSENSEFVTPKNLSVMTKYVKKKYGTNCRIILTEQGFTANSGSNIQAAAMAYTFYKAQFDPQIDAVIFRSYQDDPGEVAQGLSFGIKTAGGKKRDAYNVYKYMDTPEYAKYTNSCLKTIGATSWGSIIPGFSDAALKKLPGRE